MAATALTVARSDIVRVVAGIEAHDTFGVFKALIDGKCV